MATTTEKVVFRFEAINRASAKMKQIGNDVQDIGTKGMQAKKDIAIMGTAVLATMGLIIGKSVQMAKEFDTGMTNVSTLIDTSIESMEDMKNEVLDIGDRTPVALADLTTGLYNVRSAGIPASEAMATLEGSAQLAVAGLGSVEQAVNLSTSALNSFGTQGYDADEVMNTLFLTVKNGKTTVADLSNGFGQISGLAASLGIDFQELMAGTAALTTSGMSASTAYSGMKGALTNIIKPTTVGAELASNLGIELGAAAIESRGLAGRLEHMKEKLNDGNLSATEQTQAMTDMFGSIEGLNAVLALTGPAADAFTGTLSSMKTESDALAVAFAKQTETFENQSKQLQNNLNRLFIELGSVILPHLVTVTGRVIEKINEMRDRRDNLSPRMQIVIGVTAGVVAGLVALTAAIGVMSFAFSAATAAVGTFMGAVALLASPIILFVAAVAIRAYLIIKYRDDIKLAFDSAAKRIALKLIAMRESLISFQNNTIRDIAQWIIDMRTNFKERIGNTVTQVEEWGASLVEGIVKRIGSGLQSIISFKDDVVDTFQGLVDQALDRGKNLIQMFIDGIKSKISAVKSAVKDVASTVKNYLGFSSPTKEGPGSNADQWIPNLIDMLGRGLLDGSRDIARSAAYVGNAIGSGVNGQSFSMGTTSMPQGTNVGSSIGTMSGIPSIGMGSRSGSGGMVIQISGNTFYGTDSNLVDMISDEIMKKIKGNAQYESF